MSDLIPFDFESHVVRSVRIGGKPWFVAIDVCRVLEIRNHRHAVAQLDEDEKGVVKTDTLGGRQDMLVVSQIGLYGLSARSNKPVARRFWKWVRAELLPTLLREGRYSLPSAEQDELAAKRRYFASLPEEHRALAEARAVALDAVEARIAQGARIGAALEAVEAATGIGARTLYSLRARVWMVPRRDWPAALAPRWSGTRRMLAECHPAVLGRLRDLAGAGVKLALALRQVRAEAATEGWHPIPCDRTLRRAVARRDLALTRVEVA